MWGVRTKGRDSFVWQEKGARGIMSQLKIPGYQREIQRRSSVNVKKQANKKNNSHRGNTESEDDNLLQVGEWTN